MSEYEPDLWEILNLNSVEVGLYKVLSGWQVDYLDGGHWRMSSGVTHIKDDGDYWTITNHSGSIYKCHKNRQGMTSSSASIYLKMKDSVEIVEDIEILMGEF